MVSAIEWIVVVFALVSFIKILVVLFSRKSWAGVVKGIYGNKMVSVIVFLVLSAIVLYYLLMEMTIVQILAAGAFIALLLGAGFAAFSSDIVKMANSIFSKKFSGWVWVYTLIWIALLVWALYEIFA